VHHCRFSKYGQYTNDDLGTVFDIGNEDDSSDLTSHNLIEDCVMYHGGHHVLSVSGMYNVIRNNWLHNEPWALGAANADRGAIMYGDRVVSLSSGYPQNTGHNLFENNRIGYASDPPDNLGASNLCLGSAGNIVRFNYLFHSDRAAIAMTLTSTYWSSIVDNKIYNNTLFHNGLKIPSIRATPAFISPYTAVQTSSKTTSSRTICCSKTARSRAPTAKPSAPTMPTCPTRPSRAIGMATPRVIRSLSTARRCWAIPSMPPCRICA
jgi:hypothetical protein